MNDTMPMPVQEPKTPAANILNTAMAVIKTPVAFYGTLAKTGGFVGPAAFVAVMGMVAGVLHAIGGMLYPGSGATVAVAIGSVILTPLLFVVGSFIGGAILFLIWKLMGSAESYETAYRCGAYASAIAPITALVGLIPFAGALAEVGWMSFLMVTASVQVHKLAARTAWLVFGIIAAILLFGSISAQFSDRRVARDFDEWSRRTQGKALKNMTPEEARDAAASFFKALQQEAAQKAAAARKAAESQND